MSERAHISAKAIMSDIRDKASASDLMKKYDLSSKGLRMLLRQLISAGLADERELAEQYPGYASPQPVDTSGGSTVLTLSVPVPIHDVESPAKGILREVSPNAIRVAGLRARIGETRTFHIPVDMFMAAGPLQLQTRCTWCEIKGGNKRYPIARFEVINLTRDQKDTLERFMRVMFLSSSGEWRLANE
ncbi:MAG: hypothetical protein LDL33_09630 [Desulfomonile sp.]|nr:hypothetical protein [Desulfomonile sp.]